jgi:hypothetical protein
VERVKGIALEDNRKDQGDNDDGAACGCPRRPIGHVAGTRPDWRSKTTKPRLGGMAADLGFYYRSG